MDTADSLPLMIIHHRGTMHRRHPSLRILFTFDRLASLAY